MKVAILDIETSGLDPKVCELSAFGYKEVGGEGAIMSQQDNSEKEILEIAWLWLKNFDKFAGLYISSFDIPFLEVRSVVNNVAILKKIERHQMIDLDRILKFKKWPSQEELLSVLGLGTRGQGDGLEMVEAFKQKDFFKIKQHLKEDLLNEEKIYLKFKELNLL